jgi:hypothetical protein
MRKPAKIKSLHQYFIIGILDQRKNMLSVVRRFSDASCSKWRKKLTRLNSRDRSWYAEPLEPRCVLAAPVAVNDQYTTPEDSLLFLVPAATGVLSNDTDADQDTLKAVLVDPPRNGTLALNDDGSFIYDSNSDFFGADTFTYRAEDTQPSNVATVTLNVTSVYDPIRPVPDSYKFRPGEIIRVTPENGVLANDANPDQAQLRAIVKDNVARGTLTLREDGSFDYDPQGLTGLASFTYEVDDGTNRSAAVKVDIAITTPPQAQADTYEAREDVSLNLPADQGVLANDRDPEAIPLTATLVTGPEHGTLALAANGSFLYEPNANYFGPDQFTYFASDGFDDTPPVTVSIQVVSVNDRPASVEDAFFALPGQRLSVKPESGLLANDSDVENESLSARLVAGPAHGSVTLQAGGSFQYTPTAGYEGEDSFSYAASDGIGESAATQVYVGVAARPFVISEFMAENVGTIQTRTRQTPEGRFSGERKLFDWIEVQNTLTRPFDIGGLHLTDDPDDLTRWTFPTPTLIPAGGRVVVFASGLDITNPALDENGFLHTNFKVDSAGEYLAITAGDGSVLHAYNAPFPKQLAGISYGLTETGTGYYLAPTLGESNSGETRIGIAEGPTIETPHGFFTQPVQVTIRRPNAQTTVRYTLDGSTPSLENGIDYTGPITVDKTTVLRAAGFQNGYLTSRVDTRTYLFLSDVLTQSADGQPPPGWPARWGSNRTDYGMDPDIVNSPEWGPQMIEALTQIPSMSVVTDLPNLFDSRTGIYARPSTDGFAGERPASLELINPDGTTGFQHNIGLRIRGGFSRDTSNPKHAFRIFFDTVYGDGWLNYPLFEDEGASTFAKVDLRTTQNYSWAFQNDSRNTFLRDIFSRDIQGQLGHQYTRGRHYHLYINGQYFGLYQTDERPEAAFGATYYGGNVDDYDVVHNDPRANGATDGNLDAYRRLWEEFTKEGGLSDQNMADYYRVQGMNPDGTRNPEYERMLDVDNVIDYMIITYYTSDADGPGSKFTRPGLNNYFGMYNRENPDGWKFFEHDSEHSLDTGNAAGANYNMVTPLVNNGRTFNNFNPHWMHEQLAQFNSDYRQRFIDRVHEVFQDDGVLGDENVIRQLRKRAAEIDKAIIAESARWGDAQRSSRPYTKTDWERAVENIVRWVTSRGRGAGRRAEVLGQLRQVKWYPAEGTDAPTFSQQGGKVDPGFLLTVTATNGQIHYTTDGSDPRASGGAVGQSAKSIASGGTIPVLTGGFVKARVFRDNEWSPLTSARFFVEPLADLASLRISEVHYHPGSPSEAETAAGFDDQDQFEFIELVNVSDRTIDLAGVKLERITLQGNEQGLDFDFADGRILKLGPGERVLVVEDLAAFQFRYGDKLPVTGQWAGGLGNDSEMIILSAGDAKLQFTYVDNWYDPTDGDGFSLEARNERAADLGVWNSSDGWRASFEQGGSPGRTSLLPGDSNHDGRFDSQDLVLVLQADEYEDDIAGNSTFEEGDWNGDGDFTTLDIIQAFQTGLYENPAAAAPNMLLEYVSQRDKRRPLHIGSDSKSFGDIGSSDGVARGAIHDRVFAEL